jgi:tetratricopeptide (TPR) repeat protein
LALLYIQKYEIAQKYFEKTFYSCIKISDRDERIRCLLSFLKNSDNIFIFNRLSQIKDIDITLIENIDFSFDDSSDEIYNRYVIKFLIQKGQFKKAEEITLRLDKQERTLQLPESSLLYWDYFYYFIGKEYLKLSETREKSLDFEKKIKNNSNLRIELLLEFLESLDPIENEEEFLEIIDWALQIEIRNKLKKDSTLGKIAFFCIKAGNVKKALEIIEKVENKTSKSVLIYEVAQIYIREYNIGLAKKIISKYYLDTDIKAYILSKIAAKLMVQSKHKKSDEMFKKAIDLILNKDVGSLEYIFMDYFYASKYGRLRNSQGEISQYPLVN